MRSIGRLLFSGIKKGEERKERPPLVINGRSLAKKEKGNRKGGPTCGRSANCSPPKQKREKTRKKGRRLPSIVESIAHKKRKQEKGANTRSADCSPPEQKKTGKKGQCLRSMVRSIDGKKTEIKQKRCPSIV